MAACGKALVVVSNPRGADEVGEPGCGIGQAVADVEAGQAFLLFLLALLLSVALLTEPEEQTGKKGRDEQQATSHGLTPG
jgi:hypothetical protein